MQSKYICVWSTSELRVRLVPWTSSKISYWPFQSGSPVGLLLLLYSVLFTVESLSLLYLLFISWFICSRRCFIDKLGSFMQTKYVCVMIHTWIKGEVGTVNLQLNILLTLPRWYFFCGSFIFFSVLCLLWLCVHLFIFALWSPAGKGLTSGTRLWCLTVSLSLSHRYPGSDVVLDCVDFLSLHPYLLWYVYHALFSSNSVW